ncbi:glutamate receptor ionotropic, delta-2-like [Daphnia pulicaria]|uniref:glutamate receptor ionotropic, delta-2-like n=1 Tax=Daphnia pulicaria TaxID=35523 RepID=UPI001EEC0028|nr:glutamate receptor ionotropic, delta-2-like [Daphnia pulicaria]
MSMETCWWKRDSYYTIASLKFLALTYYFYLKLVQQRILIQSLLHNVFNFQFPPCLFATTTSQGNLSYSGICHDIITWISQQFQMELIYVPANHSEVIRFGIVSTLISQFTKQEVDIIPFPFVITPTIMQQMDFTIPLTVEDYHLLQPYPNEESRLTACISPFSFTVWLLFLLSTFAVILFMALLTFYRPPLKSISFTDAFNDNTIYVLTVITGQGNYKSEKTLAQRLVAGLWCLMMVVLVNAYTGTLRSYMTVPKLDPIVNTLTELAVSSETKMTVDIQLGKARMFLEATSGPYKLIGNSLRNNPELLVKGSSLEGMNNVLQRGAAYFANRSIIKYLMAVDMKTHPTCRMTYSDPIPFIEYYSMGLPKNSRHNWIINHDLQYLQESGLLTYWIKQRTPNVDKCKVGMSKPSGKMVSLTLVDLSSPTALLAIGIGLSFLVFLIEIILFLKTKKRKIQEENNAVKNLLFGL